MFKAVCFEPLAYVLTRTISGRSEEVFTAAGWVTCWTVFRGRVTCDRAGPSRSGSIAARSDGTKDTWDCWYLRLGMAEA
jgi:hypothetical protein